ncbi:MAG: SIR2 family protein [Rhodospirillales bacterium]
MDQAELTGLFCARPQNFAWFLGAGASRSADLPTANDMLWDLKRQYYCREETQDISRQDIQNSAVRERIQAFMQSRGFPAPYEDDEYPAYFEKIFGDDKEKQRRYIKAKLSEENLSLAIGHRVLGALLASKDSRIVFTTNFDSVVEKAIAEVSGQSLSAYHLEGAHNASAALDNEEFPLYCKLHGDFRYDSIKNLRADLSTQNRDLSACLVNAGTRLGFVVAGYSGRDASVMKLFYEVLETTNPFPHGLFWTEIKGADLHPEVTDLLEKAREKGVTAEHVQIETFDSLLLRFWRNLESKSPELDSKVRKLEITSASIPLPSVGRANPIVRLNALPIIDMPERCLSLSFSPSCEWSEIRRARVASEGELVLAKSDSVLCWGQRASIDDAFDRKPERIDSTELPDDLSAPGNLYLKGFVEEALAKALARDKPLLCRTNRSGSFLIADAHAQDQGCYQPLFDVVGRLHGDIRGLFTEVSEKFPESRQIGWAEALRVSIDVRGDNIWLQLDPDIWIWPIHAKRIATDFLDERRGDRLNAKYNAIIDAWVRIALGTDERNTEVSLKPFDEGDDAENPTFRVGSRTAFARRLVS